MNDNIIELIKKSNQLSLEEYCRNACQYIKGKENSKTLEGYLIDIKNNDNLKRLITKLKNISDLNILPILDGFIGLETIYKSVDCLPEGYLESFIDKDGLIEIYDYKINNYKKVKGDSIEVVSLFQETEVIVTSSEMPSCYFILYYGIGIKTLLAISDENLIKAMVSLSLMFINNKILNETIKFLNEKQNINIHNSLKTLNIIVSNATRLELYFDN
tara:strand:+ start:1993 stop:2640 length:648 start_codon:yes stop_codon:yes gene_type:complete